MFRGKSSRSLLSQASIGINRTGGLTSTTFLNNALAYPDSSSSRAQNKSTEFESGKAKLAHLNEQLEKKMSAMHNAWLEDRKEKPLQDQMPDEESYGMRIWDEYRRRNLWANSIQPVQDLLCKYFSLTYCKIMSVDRTRHFVSFAGDANITSELLSIHNKLSELGINSRFSMADRLTIDDDLLTVHQKLLDATYKET